MPLIFLDTRHLRVNAARALAPAGAVTEVESRYEHMGI